MSASDIFSDSTLPPVFAEPILAGTPADLQAAILTRLQSEWDNPPLTLMVTSHGEQFSLIRAREILFCPRTEGAGEDAAVYVSMLRCALHEPESSANPAFLPHSTTHNRAQISALAMLYLQHLKNWPFTEQFILKGGFAALAELVSSPNSFVRGQVLDSLLQISANPAIDWFNYPGDGDAAGLELRRKVVSASGDPRDAGISDLVYDLVQWPSDCYPGETSIRLQLLAFWLSLVRQFIMGGADVATVGGGQSLCLGKSVLAALQRWAKDSAIESKSASEIELAAKLYDDFSRFPTIDDDAIVEARQGQETSRSRIDGGTTLPPEAAGVKGAKDYSAWASALKHQGNQCYTSGKFFSALRLYGEAISDSRLAPGAPLQLQLLANRAACYLQLVGVGEASVPSPALVRAISLEFAKYLTEKGAVLSAERHHQELLAVADERNTIADTRMQVLALLSAIADCDEVLDYQPDHVKCLFRKSQALTCLGRLEAASVVIPACINSIQLSIKQAPDVSKTKLLTAAAALASGIMAFKGIATPAMVSSGAPNNGIASMLAKRASDSEQEARTAPKIVADSAKFTPTDPASLAPAAEGNGTSTGTAPTPPSTGIAELLAAAEGVERSYDRPKASADAVNQEAAAQTVQTAAGVPEKLQSPERGHHSISSANSYFGSSAPAKSQPAVERVAGARSASGTSDALGDILSGRMTASKKPKPKAADAYLDNLLKRS